MILGAAFIPAGLKEIVLLAVPPLCVAFFLAVFSGLVGVGLLWGATVPLMRNGGLAAKSSEAASGKAHEGSFPQSRGKKDANGITAPFVAIFRLLTQWRVFFPYLLNQCGSLCYYYLLGEYDLCITAPLANTLAFLFTFLTEAIINKSLPSMQDIVGCALIISGFAVCVSG
ncbi:hypothetical protein BESB_067200 [Besnoitia besnoiti]|uniref:Transmembrane protein 234 n=1 Tax=Besnoitia besnoiti TaxID=94643 RepID=A0A2A9MGG4_BESBE|nr:hypothetical protein BESB_067200 [Besnoitia besnoiti]PFH34687.1 hypothetical protein BESB_067200 [Besnoitia besnoiti]